MSDFSSRFCAARRACIARDFAKLNPEQRRGVLTTEGPLLLLAGAGSGKTTVLINRIANLLTYGRGSDCGEVPAGASEDDLAFLENYPAQPTADERRRMRQLCAVEPPAPWQVLAVTFTNKAAKELRERLAAFGIAGAGDIWALTFHSACVRILRRDIDKLGFSNDFTIYDTDDCKRVVKDILKEVVPHLCLVLQQPHRMKNKVVEVQRVRLAEDAVVARVNFGDALALPVYAHDPSRAELPFHAEHPRRGERRH